VRRTFLTTSEIWLGIKIQGKASYWVKDNESSYRNWLNGTPLGSIGDCGTLLVNGHWVVTSCLNRFPFVCKKGL